MASSGEQSACSNTPSGWTAAATIDNDYLGLYCTECPGNTTDDVPSEYRGYLRTQPFPPAGLQGRTVTEIHRAAFGGLCETCDRRRLVSVTARCTNCIIEGGGPLRTFLLADTEVLEFLTAHGLDPIAPSTAPWTELETRDEEILSREPVVVRGTFAVDDDTIRLTVDDALSVVDVTRGEKSPSE